MDELKLSEKLIILAYHEVAGLIHK